MTTKSKILTNQNQKRQQNSAIKTVAIKNNNIKAETHKSKASNITTADVPAKKQQPLPKKVSELKQGLNKAKTTASLLTNNKPANSMTTKKSIETALKPIKKQKNNDNVLGGSNSDLSIKQTHTTNSPVKLLNTVLASYYILMLKTQNYHWNVEGRNFYSLHNMFEAQYQDLQNAIDEVAESIRALGHKAAANLKEYQNLSVIKDGNENFDADHMVQDLIESNQDIFKLLTLAFNAFDGQDHIQELLSSRKNVHQKAIWFLKSSLESSSVQKLRMAK